MSAKIDEAKMEVIRMDFLAGCSLRELERRHGVSERAIAYRSKSEGWVAQRDMQRSAAAVPEIAAAADRRAEAVASGWKERVGFLCDQCSVVATRAMDLLVRRDLSMADYRDLCSITKIMVDTLAKLRETVGDNAGRPPLVVVMDLSGQSPEAQAAEIAKARETYRHSGSG